VTSGISTFFAMKDLSARNLTRTLKYSVKTRAQRKNLPPRAKAIVPVEPRADSLAALAAVPEEVTNYLDGIREDNLIDGLINNGVWCGPTGGGWTNNVTGHGNFQRDKVMQGHFREPFRISDPELSALYNGNDLAKRVVDTVPREMFRRGWVLVVPQEDDQPEPPGATTSGAGDAASNAGYATALEQPRGGESGPAAPGSPLVDPMGASPDNATARQPNAAEGRPRDPEEDDTGGVGPGGDKNPPQDGAAVGGQGDEQRPVNRVAPAAAKAGTSDPMGEELSKDPRVPVVQGGTVAPGRPESGDAMTPTANRKPAPGADDEPGKGPVDMQGGDQPKGADLAIQAEAYAARLSLKPRALEATTFARLYGGGILIVGADDGQDMALPLDETKISTIRYLAWVDRRFVFASSWYSEIGPKYGEVRTWQIVNPFGGQTNTVVHESRVVRFDGAPVDFLMRRRLLGWTLSVLQAPYDVLRQFDLSFQSIANLMADMSQAVMKINGLAQLISNDQKTLQTRMQMVDISRSSARMLYIDAENEEFERVPTPMTGVADTLEMQMLRTAAAAEMPVAILFGREPSGLNATGDADFRRFYDCTAGTQRTDLEPKLRRLYTLIFAAKDGPTSGKVPEKALEFVWHKLYEPSEKEQAEIRWLMAQADDKYIGNKTLLPEEVAMSRFRTGDLHLDTEIEIEMRETSLAGAELAPTGAAADEQENQQAIELAKAGGGPAGPPGKGPPGASGKPPFGKAGAPGKPAPAPAAKPPRADARTDAWDDARYDCATDDVYDTMIEDFPEEAITWIRAAPWRGAAPIARTQIDYSNQANWYAAQKGGEDEERVEKFRQVIRDGGKLKPIILVQRPKGKAMIVDGHHRALAYALEKRNNVSAFVARVLVQTGPWDETHDYQSGGVSGSGVRSGSVKDPPTTKGADGEAEKDILRRGK